MVHRDIHTNASIVTGIVALAFSWDSLLNQSLPASMAGMLLVIRGNSGAGSVASVAIEEGITRFLGLGARDALRPRALLVSKQGRW